MRVLLEPLRRTEYYENATADFGIRGNSHMLMMDKNHLQIADVILGWIDEQVEACKAD